MLILWKFNMKFIISENKIKNVVFKYLGAMLDESEYEGNYYFSYKDTNELVIKCVDEEDNDKIKVKISSHIVREVKEIFTIDYIESANFIKEWINEKTNKEIIEFVATPYKQELPFFVRK